MSATAFAMTRFLEQRRKLWVNRAKSAVDRPWRRTFLGYTMTAHRRPRLRVGLEVVRRLVQRVKAETGRGRGRSIAKTIAALRPVLRGWFTYFRLSEVKSVFETLDGWLRRRLRCILWRPTET
jgi:RNA-directed DNA polymerase